MSNKRIIALSEKVTPDSGDFFAMDNSSGGTKKYQVKKIIDQIAENAEDISDLNNAITQNFEQIGEFVSGYQSIVSATYPNSRYGADGSVISATSMTALEAPVSGGDVIYLSGTTNYNSTLCVRYKLSDNTITTVTDYSSTMPLARASFTVPANAVKVLVTAMGTPNIESYVTEFVPHINSDDVYVDDENIVDYIADEEKGTDKIYIQNPQVCDISQWVKWVNGSVSYSNNVLTFTAVAGTSSGLQTPALTNPSITNVKIKAILSALDFDVNMFILGKKSDNSVCYIKFDTITSGAGTYEFNIDLAYYSVYSELDLSKAFTFAFVRNDNTSASANVTAVFTTLTCEYTATVYESGAGLNTVLNEISNSVQSAENAVASMSIDSLKLTDNTGEKYVIQVTNGQLSASPVIPDNIVFIGNSLLFGWSVDNLSQASFGMAASNNQEDYYAIVKDYVEDLKPNLTTYKVYGSTFERAASVAEQQTWMNDTLLPHLSNSVDLVIVQMGDNVGENTSLAFFDQSAPMLLSFIRENAPNARVAWVAEWFATAQKQAIIANACAKTGSILVDISDLYANTDNRAHIGDVITFPDSTTRTITDSGVAAHPSSTGMAAIADRIIQTLF